MHLRHPSTMEKLPWDILTNIFIRLRAKQLATMRCVSKPFLSQPDFIKTHLNHSTHNHNKDDEIVLVFNNLYIKDKPLFTAHLLKSPTIHVNDRIKLPVNFPSHPELTRLYDCGVFGSVNGLISFYTNPRPAGPVIHIWNPSLSALVTLPPLSGDHLYPVKLCRFGYDPNTDDYKVVKLPYDRPTELVEVYSMRENSWISVKEKFPVKIVDREIVSLNEVCIDGHDGHVHWLRSYVVDQRHQFLEIIAFDLGLETFSVISLPDSISKLGENRVYYRRDDLALGSWAGKLCIMSHTRHGKFEVWVMNEYGVAESWVKHHNVSSQFSDSNIEPIGFTLNNKFLYGVERKIYNPLSLYDPDTTKVARFSSCLNIFGRTKVVHYTDSLVWVAPLRKHGSTGCRRVDTREKSKEEQNLIIHRETKSKKEQSLKIHRKNFKPRARHYWHR